MDTLEKMTKVLLRISKNRDYLQGYCDALSFVLNVIAKENVVESKLQEEIKNLADFEDFAKLGE